MGTACQFLAGQLSICRIYSLPYDYFFQHGRLYSSFTSQCHGFVSLFQTKLFFYLLTILLQLGLLLGKLCWAFRGQAE
jgi:hypothetical protein